MLASEPDVVVVVSEAGWLLVLPAAAAVLVADDTEPEISLLRAEASLAAALD